MPHPDAILQSAAAIAQGWWIVAIVWHAYFGGLVVVAIKRPISQRTLAWLLIPPFVSVSAVAWAAGNPVNGGFFAKMSLALGVLATRLPRERARLAPSPPLISGLVLFVFGWFYPHFLGAALWPEYAVAAPLGLLPCPTLSTVIGVALMFGVYRSRWWAGALTGPGAVYGIVGLFWLGVTIDVVLLAGAVVLWAFSVSSRQERLGIAPRPEQTQERGLFRKPENVRDAA